MGFVLSSLMVFYNCKVNMNELDARIENKRRAHFRIEQKPARRVLASLSKVDDVTRNAKRRFRRGRKMIRRARAPAGQTVDSGDGCRRRLNAARLLSLMNVNGEASTAQRSAMDRRFNERSSADTRETNVPFQMMTITMIRDDFFRAGEISSRHLPGAVSLLIDRISGAMGALCTRTCFPTASPHLME